jgi:colanic acid biosynthesis glycosyl transferase WcaI
MYEPVVTFSINHSTGVTAVSEYLAEATRHAFGIRVPIEVIPNFVDTEFIGPLDRMTAYRTELGIGAEPVVMYAGNVGFSQSLDLLVGAARELPEVTFVVNGDGAARPSLEAAAAGLANIRFVGYQPKERLPEVLASADLHVVPLKAGLGAVSVPSKTYSILAAGRPVLAAIDPDTEVPRMLAASGGGRVVPPDDLPAFIDALRSVLADPAALAAQGAAARRWVEHAASPRAVAQAYASLIERL